MKKTRLTAIKIILSLVILWFLAHTSKLDFSLLKELIYSPALLTATIFIYFSVVMTSAWRWYQLNKVQNLPLNFSNTIIPTYLGIAFNNLLPGGVGGDFFRCYFLFKKIPNQKSAVMLSILFDRITGLMGVFVAACLAIIYHFNIISQSNAFLYFCILASIGILVLSLAFIFLPKRVGLSTWLDNKFSHKKWLAPLLSALEAIRLYRNSKIVILKCLVASLSIQVLIALTCMMIAKMMHFPAIAFSDYVLAVAITQIVNLIPITPGGFGIGEAAFANILMFLNPGVTATYATIFLAYRIVGIIAYLPGLAIFVFDSRIVKGQVVVSSL